MTSTRKSWDHYFMDIAFKVSDRATCKRRKVGALLIKNHHIVGSGYNGAPKGVPDCIEADCLIAMICYPTDIELRPHCIRTIHAEQNVILSTDSQQRSGATLYVTDQPCWNCANLIANSGIVEVIFCRPYTRTGEIVQNLFTQKGIIFRQIKDYILSPEYMD
jgi:dCMP deaminase